jgi:hypothetical protein
MIKKELICHIQTLEEGEFIKVNAIEGESGYFLLTLGQMRMVVNGPELVEAMSNIDYYSTMFKQEAIAKENRAKAPPKTVVNPCAEVAAGSGHFNTLSKRKGKKNTEDEEGTIVLEPQLRTGPTASELALEKQTKMMQGETLVLKENK